MQKLGECPGEMKVIGVIDMTPTWTGLLPVLRALVEDPSIPWKQRQDVWGEIGKMALAADRYNELVKKPKRRKT